MLIDRGLARQVDEFWENAGREVGFPRDLRAVVSLALPLTVEYIDRLAIADVQQWLDDRNMLPLRQQNRRLRGCLLAFLGHGSILIDGDDPVDEQRFTLAHEIAHFMVDYHALRLEAIAALGPTITEVLDKLRPPTHTERLHGILRDISFGLHIDLLERSDSGDYGSSYILKAENRADQLAFALLAPAEDAREQIELLGLENNYNALSDAATIRIARRYGLPARQARAYAGWLLRRMGYKPSFRERFNVQS